MFFYAFIIPPVVIAVIITLIWRQTQGPLYFILVSVSSHGIRDKNGHLIAPEKTWAAMKLIEEGGKYYERFCRAGYRIELSDKQLQKYVNAHPEGAKKAKNYFEKYGVIYPNCERYL